MRRRLRAPVRRQLLRLFVGGACCVAQAIAQTSQHPPISKPDARIRFHFELAGMPVPEFEIVVKEDGAGTYITLSPNGRNTQAMHISALVRDKLFYELRSFHSMKGEACDLKMKNLAFTGKKTLEYSDADGRWQCEFIYPADERIQQASDTMQAVAYTMDEGATLERLLRHDRLGLDAEMQTLVQAVKDGRAVELQNIQQTLRSIAEDDRVMMRVRTQAEKLLKMAAEPGRQA
jgi:hypothetical protein